MQFTLAFLATMTIIITASAQAFPPSVTNQGILNIQNYINNVINDLVQSKTAQIANDYSSAGRSLNFLSRDVLGNKNCAKLTTGKLAKTRNEAIADLQATQLTLSELELDVINKDLTKGQKDVCRAVALYGNVAQYVDKIRTDGQKK